MLKKIGRISVGLALTASALVGALSLGAFSATDAAAQGMSNDAHVRVLHASPDAPAVDVYVNGSKAFGDLAFGKSSEWASLPAGTYDVKVTPAGGTTGVIEAKLTLEGGKYYTVAAVGKLANIAPKVIEDNLSTLDAGKARLRVVHASPDAPAVDVAVKGGAVLVPNLAFPNASDYLVVDPMTVDVEVRPAGTTTVALAVPGLTLEAGKVYTVYATGLLNGTPALAVVPVVDTAMAPMMAGGESSAPGMPVTGAGDNLFNVAAVALVLVALATMAGGLAVRVRNR